MKEKEVSKTQEKKDANTVIALGAGVGVLGTAGAIITGAVCPLCIIVTPGLIGFGAYRRWKSGAGGKEE